MKKITLISIILLIASCAQVTSLNLKKHQFGLLPTKIIWIQVAGLNEEHLAFLKYSKQYTSNKTAFEDFLCVGKSWEYNLFQIRPTAYSGFLSQLTGKKNIKSTCEDYELMPIWKYMLAQGYIAGIFEGEMTDQDSLLTAQNCREKGDKFLEGTTIWKMSKKTSKDIKYFHVNEKIDYKPSQVYFDKSCLTGECYSTFSTNAIKLYEQFTRKSSNYLYIVKDFNFMNQLAKQDIKNVKNDLLELEKTVQYFQEVAASANDVLLLLTTAASKNVEFPRAGKEWEEFEKSGKYIINKKSQLIGSVFASGARAENFCGIYDQTNILTRIFSGAKQQGLELMIINPFQQ